MTAPRINRKVKEGNKSCSHCGEVKGSGDFVVTTSWFYKDNLANVCNDCIKERLIEKNFDWDEVEHLCMTLDIPFIPKEFERLRDINGDDVFPFYAKVFQDAQFEGLGWKDYFERFSALRSSGILEKELPELREARLKKMRQEWGANYLEDELEYLQALFEGMLATQNINGALQTDQAKKLCKISLVVDSRIRAGEDFDKMMTSYDRMVKTAEFTPKNVKNENDFDSFGEVFAWLERRGWLNEYYDGVSRDVVDEVISNLQTFNQRLYTNESNMGEMITDRITALRELDVIEGGGSKENEDLYDLDIERDLEEYDQEGYVGAVLEEEDEDIFLFNDETEVDMATKRI